MEEPDRVVRPDAKRRHMEDWRRARRGASTIELICTFGRELSGCIRVAHFLACQNNEIESFQGQLRNREVVQRGSTHLSNVDCNRTDLGLTSTF